MPKREFSEKNSQNDIKNILHALPENIYWMDINGTVLGCNDRQAMSLGFKNADDLIGVNLHEIGIRHHWGPGVAEKILENNAQVIKSQKSFEFEEFVLLNGKQRVYLSHKKPLYNHKQEVIGILGTSVDITNRKTAENKIKKSRLKAKRQSKITNIYLANILANMPEHFYWTNKEGTILGCNERQAGAFGLTSAQLVGKNIYDVADLMGWSKEVADRIRQNDLEVMATKKSKVVEEVGFFDNVTHTFLSYKSPLTDDVGNVIGTFGFSVDITERKRTEQELKDARAKAEAASRLKTEFIMNMGHDLRTPFSGILGFSKMLYEKETDLSKKEKLGYIVESSEYLLKMFNQFLEVSKIDTEHIVVNQDNFCLKNLINNIINLLRSAIEQKNLQLIFEYDSAIPDNILGDKLKTERILLNLLNNAIKFTKNGYIKLNAKLIEKLDEDITLSFTIQDSGIGIPANRLNYIFEKFSRFTPAYDGVYEGVGLGLHIVKQLIESMRGKIEVTSQINEGTTFICDIPFQVAHHQVDDYTPNTNKKTPISLGLKGKLHIFLIEDNKIAQKLAKDILEDCMHCVEVADNATQALGSLQRNVYDVILIDIGLPDMNGLILADSIKKLDNKNSTVPLVALTAHFDYKPDQERLIPLLSLLDGVLEKPLTKEACVTLFS